MRRELAGLRKAFAYALAGIGYLLASQRNTHIHLALTAVAIGLALWLGLTATEWAILALTIGLVFALEGVNTAIEAAVDLCSPQPHPLARIAKDTAAGAVLLAAVAAIAVAGFLFLPRLFALLP